MVEREPIEDDREPEGWGVRQRVAYVSAVVIPAVLLSGVVLAGLAYAKYLQPLTHQTVKTFPAPGVETFIHDGLNDPERAPTRAKSDPAIAAAERAMLANGQAGWRE